MSVMTAKLAIAQARLNARLPLILVTDDRYADWSAAARRLPPGSLVIARAKTGGARAALAQSLAAISHIRLLIAGDAALAADIGADGLHLPQARAREAGHWRARFPDWIITAAAHDPAAVRQMRHADAVLLSPVFPTASHPGAAALGPLRAAAIAAAAPVPVYALGGVDAKSAARLGPAFSGLAAIGAFL